MIFNMGNVRNYELPVLNSNYPADVTIMESANGSATFQVVIATDGKPAEYSYQWYVNNSAVSGATSNKYTKSGLTAAATYTVRCEVTNKAGTIASKRATLTVKSTQPVYSFNGTHKLTRQNAYDWVLELKSSGTLRFSYLGNTSKVDVFCVGGGGGGGAYTHRYYGGGGGGGGYTQMTTGKPVEVNKDYVITIGAGGVHATHGGNTTAMGLTAIGGNTGADYGAGGNGGCGGGAGGYSYNRHGGNGGSDGGNGTDNRSDEAWEGRGQGRTTRAWHEAGATQYAGGGGGGSGISSDGDWSTPGTGGAGGGANGNGGWATGAGAGGGGAKAMSGEGGGGSAGMVLFRNAR